MIDLKRFLHDYHSRNAAEASKPLPTARIAFDPPATVKKATWHQPGHGLLFCVHGKSYFEPCSTTTCRRTKREADSRMAEFIASIAVKSPEKE